MSLHIAKLFKSPLTLAAGALIVHISAVTAADSTGDTQQQVKELLTWTTIAHSASQSGPREHSTSPTADAQEFVKQLLLGTTASRVGGDEAIKHSEVAGTSGETNPKQRPVPHSDIQAAVRQLLLGTQHAIDAS